MKPRFGDGDRLKPEIPVFDSFSSKPT
ncbi:uncharacterized protein METZ01_LOCUS309585, partial [marine metagenome]